MKISPHLALSPPLKVETQISWNDSADVDARTCPTHRTRVSSSCIISPTGLARGELIDRDSGSSTRIVRDTSSVSFLVAPSRELSARRVTRRDMCDSPRASASLSSCYSSVSSSSSSSWSSSSTRKAREYRVAARKQGKRSTWTTGTATRAGGATG